MLKHIYRLVICIIIFGVSVAIFSRNIHEENHKQEMELTQMGNTTFPVMTARCKGTNVVTMHGYITNLDPTTIRDGIIPIDTDQKVNISIVKNETNITKGTYEIADVKTGEMVEDGKINSFSEKDGVMTTQIALEQSYIQNQEYALTVTLVTDKGDKIRYYSRIKKMSLEYFEEIMDYAKEFHNDVLDKDKASNVVNHIEPDNTMDNTDLAYVNIHSSLDLISYGDLGPKVITAVRPTVREISEDTGVIELEFYIKAKTGSGTEIYRVLESFRIRWTATRMYLLYYDRTMESVFDINLVSVSKNEFKLGITQATNANYISTEDESKLAFVRNGELWYYNTALNQVSRVYSFRQEDTDYIRDIYDNHDIKILEMDEFGNMNFMVYGYMNSGDYEGRIGIVLYKYITSENRIEEQAYIPVNVPYNVLKGYISDFAYVNAHNVFYFSLGGCIYSYDMITDKLQTIAEGISDNNMVMPENGNFMAWMDFDATDAKINMMDLETGEKSTLESKKGNCIRLLGGIGSNVIYGYAKIKDIANSADGSQVIPINKVKISGLDGKVIKEYTPDSGYVTSAEVSGNKIKFSLVKKDDGGYYIPTNDDYIFNSDMVETEIKTSYRLTDKTMTEWYLSIPKSVNISAKPEVSDADITVLDEEKIIKVDLNALNQTRYYVFAYHGLESQFENAGDAITLADERMGTVFDSKGCKIWERGAALDSATVKVDAVNEGTSIESSMTMLLNSAHASVKKGESLSIKNSNITDVLAKYIDNPVNLTGATLDEVLYYVSSNRPVIAMLSSTRAVLITSYTSSTVTYIEPGNGTVKKKIKDASRDFESVGNVFISYGK